MLHRIILAGLATCLLAPAFGFSQPATAQARDCSCWINTATGKPYPSSRLVPLGMRPIDFEADPNHYKVPKVPGAPLSDTNWVRDSSGAWINTATGEPYPCSRLVPLGMRPIDFEADPNHYKVPKVPGAPLSDTNWVRVPCPPPSTTSSGLPPSGGGTYAVGGWIGGGQPVLVLGGNIGGGWSRNSYSDFPTFDGSGAGGGVYGAARFYVQPNFFVGPETGFMLLDINARNPDSAFGFVRTDAYLGGQAGITVQGPGASKINLYTGLDANWSRIVVGVEAADERMSKTLGGWSVHGGVELQPIPSIPTLWLGLDLRHSDVSGTIGVDPTHVRWNMLSVTLSIQR